MASAHNSNHPDKNSIIYEDLVGGKRTERTERLSDGRSGSSCSGGDVQFDVAYKRHIINGGVG